MKLKLANTGKQASIRQFHKKIKQDLVFTKLNFRAFAIAA